jgi:hypothetical protein
MLNNIHDPGAAISAVMMLVACLICGSYPVIKMIGWWTEGGVEPIMAVVSIFLYVVLLVSVTMMPPAIGIVILLVILASAIMVPVFGQMSEQIQHQHMEDDKMERYGHALEQDPMNHAARMGLAEVLHKKGELDQAIEHMSWVLQQAPSLSFRIRPQLESWKREKERVGVPMPIYCHQCRAENPWNATQCYECGAAFGVRSGMKQQVWREGGPKVVIRGWIVTATTLVIGCFIFLNLPSIIAGPIILATIIVAFFLFLKWVGGDMGTIGD